MVVWTYHYNLLGRLMQLQVLTANIDMEHRFCFSVSCTLNIKGEYKQSHWKHTNDLNQRDIKIILLHLYIMIILYFEWQW